MIEACSRLRDVPCWRGVGRRDREHVTPPETDGARGGRDQTAGGIVCLYQRRQRQTILPYHCNSRTGRCDGNTRENVIGGVDYLHSSSRGGVGYGYVLARIGVIVQVVSEPHRACGVRLYLQV